jgi:hypothetical protein
MRKFTLSLTAVGALLAFGLYSAPASAQATRTWVSGVGDDANPCSRTAPCKTFAGAISKTAAKGEINCLDPGGFGGVTINKSLTISCGYTEGGVLVSGTNAIVVTAVAGDEVFLRGLDIEGLGTGLNGVSITGAAKVYVIDTWIRGFTQNGINMTGTGAHLFVNSSYITNNGQAAGTFGGVNVGGASNIANLHNTQVLSNGNGATGFAVNASSSTAAMSLQTSVLNDSVNAISRVAGAQVICVGPSNLISGGGTCSSSALFQ